MIVGYARTSTIEQEAGFEAQLRQLKAAGCEKVFSEQVSAVAATREQLEAALDFVREGDVFVCCKLDLLGSIAQFERELTRERMLVGIAKARSEGKYKGRAPTARAKTDRRELRDA